MVKLKNFNLLFFEVKATGLYAKNCIQEVIVNYD